MATRKSNKRSLTIVEQPVENEDAQHVRSTSNPEQLSTTCIQQNDQLSTAPSLGFNFLQSIKDLTHQELSRANPLGLLGKEVISFTGTTHCPEPVPPIESGIAIVNHVARSSISSSNSPTKLSLVNENPSQQVRFPLNEEEKLQMQRRRSTLANLVDTVLPPGPGEFLVNDTQPHLFSQPSSTTLLADFIPDQMTINVFEVFIYAWGVIAFFFDMITDLVLAHAYYLEGAYWLFLLTLMCVVLPNITLSVFSLVWYMDSSQLKASSNEFNSEDGLLRQQQNSSCQTENFEQMENKTFEQNRINQHKHFRLSSTTINILTWIIRIIILVLQLDLCLKYIRGLYYTWKGFVKRHEPKWARFYLTKQILIDADIALLRVFDCFMDSGSQVTLQLYIMLRLGSTSMKFDTLFLKQCLSIVSSLGSLAYALSGYSRCWRHMQLTHSPQGWPKGKPPPQLVSWWSTIIQWFWYLFLITPRVLALAMFAATFRSWFWIILMAHWCGMLFWILRFRTIFCISDQTKYNPREAIFEKCYNLVCSYIFIFCYMNLRKGDTRTHYIGFYTIYYIENIAFSIIYAIHSAENNLIFKYSLVIFVCCGFWVAVLFQLIYYRFLHPSDHVRLSTKENLSSFVNIRKLPLKKSKSCEHMFEHHDLQPYADHLDLIETTSLQLEKPIDEQRHNRFAKGNRQKLIFQQQIIDQKVKLTRLEEATKRPHSAANRFLTKISTTIKRPTKLTTTLVEQPNNPLTTCEQQGRIYKIEEDSDINEERFPTNETIKTQRRSLDSNGKTLLTTQNISF